MSHPLFHKVLKVLKERDIERQTLIVAVSGGVDSVTLLHLLSKMFRPLHLKLFGVYIHHGPTDKPSLNQYRDKAEIFVKNFCSENDVHFLYSQSKKKLSGENDMREFRHACLKSFLEKEKAHWIALAHNSNDVLETRMIHLIRGCGSEGLKSMNCVQPPLLRPLVFSSREEITDYAKKNKLKWLEDPSNKDTLFFRNWLRKKWLPLLEKKRPQSLTNLSRSLSLIAETEKDSPLDAFISNKGIKRKNLLELGPVNQKRVLAYYMRIKNLSGYSLSHIEELQKHIHRSQKSFTVRLLKRIWHITPEWIFVKD